MPQPLTPGATNLIDLTQLYDRFSEEYLDTEAGLASITATLKTTALVNVTDAVDLDVDHVTGSAGKTVQYVGRIPSTVSLAYDTRYILFVTATWNDGTQNIVGSFPVACKTIPLPT